MTILATTLAFVAFISTQLTNFGQKKAQRKGC